jgi:hypothetical protein
MSVWTSSHDCSGFPRELVGSPHGRGVLHPRAVPARIVPRRPCLQRAAGGWPRCARTTRQKCAWSANPSLMAMSASVDVSACICSSARPTLTRFAVPRQGHAEFAGESPAQSVWRGIQQLGQREQPARRRGVVVDGCARPLHQARVGQREQPACVARLPGAAPWQTKPVAVRRTSSRYRRRRPAAGGARVPAERRHKPSSDAAERTHRPAAAMTRHPTAPRCRCPRRTDARIGLLRLVRRDIRRSGRDRRCRWRRGVETGPTGPAPAARPTGARGATSPNSLADTCTHAG